MDNSAVLKDLIDQKVERILKTLFENKDELFHINKLSEKSNVPLATTFRIIKRLSSLNIVTSIKIKKFKIYKLNLNKKTKLLMSLIK